MIDIVERCRNHSAPWAQEAADEIERLRALVIDNSNAADRFHLEIERLRTRVSQLVMALDVQHGTPCEQIRHNQEVEDLRAQTEEDTEKIYQLIEDKQKLQARNAELVAALQRLRAELVSYRRALATSEAVNAELLAALKLFSKPHGRAAYDNARAAIEKAEGHE